MHGELALADIGLSLDKINIRDVNQGLGTWAQARAAGVDEQTIRRQREVRNDYCQEYPRAEAIKIEGVIDTLAKLSRYAALAIGPTAELVDFAIIHENADTAGRGRWESRLFSRGTARPSAAWAAAAGAGRGVR